VVAAAVVEVVVVVEASPLAAQPRAVVEVEALEVSPFH
jgi:hypothetical protein